MSIAESNEKPKPDTRPHTLHLAVHFTDNETGRLVDYSTQIARQANADVDACVNADVDAIIARLTPVIVKVLTCAAERADAAVTIALLKRG